VHVYDRKYEERWLRIDLFFPKPLQSSQNLKLRNNKLGDRYIVEVKLGPNEYDDIIIHPV